MKKVLFVLILLVISVFVLVLLATQISNAQEITEGITTDESIAKPMDFQVEELVSYPMPPITKTDYKVIGWNSNRTKFWMTPVNEGYYRGCKIITMRTKCIDPNLDPPTIGTIYGVTLQGWLSSGIANMQRVIFEDVEELDCKVYAPWASFKSITPEPECCDTCKNCFWLVDKDGRPIKSLGCLPYVDTTDGKKPFVLPTVNLVHYKQYLKSITECSDGRCPKLSVYINGKPLTDSRFADCNGVIGCVDINFSTTKVPIDFVYWDRGCRCVVRANTIDP